MLLQGIVLVVSPTHLMFVWLTIGINVMPQWVPSGAGSLYMEGLDELSICPSSASLASAACHAEHLFHQATCMAIHEQMHLMRLGSCCICVCAENNPP